jgi:uncharacterized protein (TIGR03084 family)
MDAVRPFSQPADFRDETEALYARLAPLGESALARETAFKTWTIGDIVAHLHVWNWGADLALTDPARFDETFRALDDVLAKGGTMRDFERRHLGGLGEHGLIEGWRNFAVAMADRFAAADPSARVKWAGPDMSVRSSITARLMETWAHGQAIYDLLGILRRNADRIRNIVVLGINTYEWSFKVHGRTPPSPKPHLRLTAPSGALWTWNEASESDLIEGPAEDFCQVVTQVRNIADTRLTVRGAPAAAWMKTAQCFAGPPETPPAPGARRTAPAPPAWART